MGYKKIFLSKCKDLGYDGIKPIVPDPPANDEPADLALIMDDVIDRLRSGAGDWDIAVEFQVKLSQVKLAREWWKYAVSMLAPTEPVI